MELITYSRNEILLLTTIIRQIRKETGLALKMQSENFLTRLNTTITRCKNPKTHELYHEFLDTFSQPDILQQLGLIQPRSTEEINKTVYRGQVHSQQKTLTPSKDQDTPTGKRKIVYRGQVKYVD